MTRHGREVACFRVTSLCHIASRPCRSPSPITARQPLGSGVKRMRQSHVACHSGRFDLCGHPAFSVRCAKPGTGQPEHREWRRPFCGTGAALPSRDGRGERKDGSGLALSWVNVLCSRKHHGTVNSDPWQCGDFRLFLEKPRREWETSVFLSCASAGPAGGRRARLGQSWAKAGPPPPVL